MSVSSAPAVKAALLGLLQTDPNLVGVQIAYSHPGADIQQEAIYFHRTIENEAAAALGTLRRDEDYDFEVVVDVVQDGNDPQSAEERCWALVAVVENIVRTNVGPGSGHPLSDVVSGWVVFHTVEMTPHIEHGQRLAEAICKVHVKNRK